MSRIVTIEDALLCRNNRNNHFEVVSVLVQVLPSALYRVSCVEGERHVLRESFTDPYSAAFVYASTVAHYMTDGWKCPRLEREARREKA